MFQSPKNGQRILLSTPDGILDKALGTVLEGPIWLDNDAVYRVRVEELAGEVVWVPQDWLSPVLRVV